MSIFKGCATALVTPFDETGVDFYSFERFLDFQLENGIDALVVLGTTGESATMTEEEKIRTADFAIKHVRGRVPVIVGTGSNNTREVVRYSRIIESLGADALLVVTPFYNKCTQNGLIEHYMTVADAVKTPVVCYNVPTRTGVNILPETFRTIAEHKNICAIKEASGNIEQISETIRLSQGLAEVISGDDGLTVPSMCMGATGVISVASNVFPSFVREMTALALKGDFDNASKMQLKLNPFVKGLFCEVNPIPVKYALSKLGYIKNILRLPLTPVTKADSDKIDALMNDFIN
ncbi:MAG: 4-hydroxy-tetrahydrodipicolinate synthase [Christensenellales bacterium]